MKKLLCLIFVCFFFINPGYAGNTIITDVINMTITDTSTKVLDVDKNRNFLLIENEGGSSVFVKFDSVHSGAEGIEVKSGEKYTFTEAPVNSVYMVSSASQNNSVVIVSGDK